MNIQSIYFQFDIIKFSANIEEFRTKTKIGKKLTFEALGENQFITKPQNFYYLLTVVQIYWIHARNRVSIQGLSSPCRLPSFTI